MDDSACQEFFAHPSQTYHRRYEALRAVFVDGQSQKEVAKQFGYTYGSLRQLVLEFRRQCANGVDEQSPFFERCDQDHLPPSPAHRKRKQSRPNRP